MKYRLFFVIISIFSLLLSGSLLGQCPDPDDPGNCDTLWIEQENGRIQPNTVVVRTIKAYWDEVITVFAIPIKYKNPQTDVFLDSMKLTTFSGITTDTVIDRSAGTLLYFIGDLTGGTIPPGKYTLATIYFRTGPSWDPSIPNPLDTFTVGQGLSFVDTATNDIQPVYDPPGNLDVGDDRRAQSAKPNSFLLAQNYPNPFNARTVISFALPRSSHVKIEIFNILGQKVRDLVDEEVVAGYKQVVWDGKGNSGEIVASGIYLYRIRAGDFVETRKMTLLK